MWDYLANINWLSYFFYNILIALLCVGFYFLMRNKSEKVKYYTILSLLILGIFIHFSKLLIPEYQNNMPESLLEITLSTPCAISALTFPFIYLFVVDEICNRNRLDVLRVFLLVCSTPNCQMKEAG